MAEKTRCEICDRNFPSLDALTMHNSAKHQSQTNVKANKLGNKTFVYFWIILFIVGGIIYFISSSGNSAGDVINNAGEIQKINIGFKNNYYPNTITVNEGIPVEITLDNSVRGCYRSFNIGAFGVSQYSSNQFF